MRSVPIEMSVIDKSAVPLRSSMVVSEEWSKTQLEKPDEAEGEVSATQRVVAELQAIQTPREVKDLLWDSLPPVQHKRGRPIDNIRRKVNTPCEHESRPAARGSLVACSLPDVC